MYGTPNEDLRSINRALRFALVVWLTFVVGMIVEAIRSVLAVGGGR